jgi:hypothetical protein
MLPLGTTIPAFRLPTATGEMVSSDVYNSRPLLVAFICHHCPFVRHIRREFARFTTEFQGRGLELVAINSNDSVAFPEDAPEGMRQEAQEAGHQRPGRAAEIGVEHRDRHEQPGGQRRQHRDVDRDRRPHRLRDLGRFAA